MITAHLLIIGFVQGVGFRQFVKKEALRRGLTGWVKNLPDGSVEAIVSGKPETIKEMIAIVKKGTMFSNVKDISVLWKENEDRFDSFEIVFD